MFIFARPRATNKRARPFMGNLKLIKPGARLLPEVAAPISRIRNVTLFYLSAFKKHDHGYLPKKKTYNNFQNSLLHK